VRGSAARLLLPALVVLALVAVVAIAATGETEIGTGDSRPPADTLMDIVISAGLVAVALGGILFLYGLTNRQLIAREIAKHGRKRLMLPTFAGMLALLVIGAYYKFRDWEQVVPVDEIGERAFPNEPPPEAAPGQEITDYEPSFSWIPVAVVVALVVGGAVAFLVAERRRRGPVRPAEDLAEQIAAVLDDTLDDLRAEADPRRAVIAAYARLERVLGAYGVPRDPALTPGEYVGRVLAALDVGEPAVQRLTGLFAEAKFSTHEIDAGMKDEAIDALVTVRDDLRRAAQERHAEPPCVTAGQPA
jgi:hypothetical protein